MADPASNRDGTKMWSDIAPRTGKRFELPARTTGALVSATRSSALDTEAVTVTVNERGDSWIALLQLAATEVDGAATLADQARACLAESSSLHAAMRAMRQGLAAANPRRVIALGIIGLSPSDGCAEVLNAGLPPIVCAHRDGSLMTFPARSGPLIDADRAPHPYERVALSWEASWLMAARSGGDSHREAMSLRAIKLDLAQAGPALAAMDPDPLTERVRVALGGIPGASTTLVIAAARRALDRGSANV